MPYRSESSFFMHCTEKIPVANLNSHLEKMSQEGWELVSACVIQSDQHWDAFFQLFWKRPHGF